MAVDENSHVRPPPQYEFILPCGGCEFYDPFVATAVVVGDGAAVERVNPSVGVDITGLPYADRTALEFRIEAGAGRRSVPPLDRAPDCWRGRITDVVFGGCGARISVTYEWPGGQNTSALKPVPEYGNGYSLSALDAVVEFYGLDPTVLPDLDTDLPVPVRQPFDDVLHTIDYHTVRDRLLEEVWWGHRPDAFVTHPPWRPDLATANGTLDAIYDRRGEDEWVGLNPKYRGEW